jgi:hypothetical protein
VTEGSPKFRTGRHVHDWIINTVKHERVPEIIPYCHNVVTVGIQPDTPVNDNGVTRHGKGTQPKRQNVDGQVESGLNFEPVYFRTNWNPRKRFSVMDCNRIVDGL